MRERKTKRTLDSHVSHVSLQVPPTPLDQQGTRMRETSWCGTHAAIVNLDGQLRFALICDDVSKKIN